MYVTNVIWRSASCFAMCQESLIELFSELGKGLFQLLVGLVRLHLNYHWMEVGSFLMLFYISEHTDGQALKVLARF